MNRGRVPRCSSAAWTVSGCRRYMSPGSPVAYATGRSAEAASRIGPASNGSSTRSPSARSASRWEPTRTRVGASSSPTSDSRTSSSIVSGRPDTAHEPSGLATEASMCQPRSSTAALPGKRIGMLPRASRGTHPPGPAVAPGAWRSRGLLIISPNAPRPVMSAVHTTGSRHPSGSSGDSPICCHTSALAASPTSRGTAASSFTNPSVMNRSTSTMAMPATLTTLSTDFPGRSAADLQVVLQLAEDAGDAVPIASVQHLFAVAAGGDDAAAAEQGELLGGGGLADAGAFGDLVDRELGALGEQEHDLLAAGVRQGLEEVLGGLGQL